MIGSDFKITICSDQDYEDLIAEVYYKGEFVALISQERGFANLEIRIHPSTKGSCWNFQLEDFEKAIAHAKKRLRNLRRNPENPGRF